MIRDTARQTGTTALKVVNNNPAIACKFCLEFACFARQSHQVGVVQSFPENM